jgi:hypothetical protein
VSLCFSAASQTNLWMRSLEIEASGHETSRIEVNKLDKSIKSLNKWRNNVQLML